MSTTTLRRSARVSTSTKTSNDVAEKETPKAKAPAPKKRPQKVNTAKPSLNKPAPAPAASAVDTNPTTPLRKKRKTVEKPTNGATTTPLTAAATATTTARPASPHATNAPLASPSGTVLVAAPSPAQKRKAATAMPDMGAQGPADATAETVLSDAEAFLVRVDPKLKTLVEKHRCDVFTPEGLSEVVEPFEKLTSGIIGQQVCLFSVFVGRTRRCDVLCYVYTRVYTQH
jgi:DNA-3-methyladenine glycosylase II